jgi:nucleotide-binding universal stress UspA family protein
MIRGAMMRTGQRTPLRSILLAYDAGAPARRALERAAELASAAAASVTVISVVPVRPGRAGTDPLDNRAMHTQAVREAKELLWARGVRTVGFVAAGDPPRLIEQTARDGAFDLVVIGTRRLGRLGRILWGSVSDHVAAHAGRAVLIVP